MIETKLLIAYANAAELAQKNCKSKHNWLDKLIYCESCKKFKFNHENICYILNQASVLENERHKHQLDFEKTNVSPNFQIL